jgi:hypothetical protein
MERKHGLVFVLGLSALVVGVFLIGSSLNQDKDTQNLKVKAQEMTKLYTNQKTKTVKTTKEIPQRLTALMEDGSSFAKIEKRLIELSVEGGTQTVEYRNLQDEYSKLTVNPDTNSTLFQNKNWSIEVAPNPEINLDGADMAFVLKTNDGKIAGFITAYYNFSTRKFEINNKYLTEIGQKDVGVTPSPAG